jgi:hypothetical protein
MPAHVATIPRRRYSSRSRGPSAKIIITPYLAVAFIGVPILSVLHGLGLLSSGQMDQVQIPLVAQPSQNETGNWQGQVMVSFVPGYQLDSSQMEIYELVDTVPNNPEKWGLDNLGLSSLGLTEIQKEVFKALVHTESLFQHYDPETGEVLTSDYGCKGATQGCNNVCPREMWLAPTTNVWCGAKTFLSYWNHYDVDANPLNLHLALAGYKGAFLMIDTDLDGNKDTVVYDSVSDLPIVDPDLVWQVEKVTNQLVWFDRPGL